jgi:N-acetylglucosamine kinase-like BadF-type ATPase
MNLVVDLGQSGARVKIGEEILKLDSAKNTSETTLESLEKVFHQIPKGEYKKVFLSLTGLLGDVGSVEPFGLLCSKFFNSSEVYVMDDGLAAYFGALGNKNGVVLTLGGGVVAVAGNNGNFGHADGKGQIFGDLGGGFWIGQAGLRRAIATLDLRDNAADLVSALQIELAAHEALSNRTGVEAAALCISAAKTVIQAAEKGAPSAHEILKTAAQLLGNTVIAAWDKVKDQSLDKPTITFLGGLSRSSLYVSLITQEIKKKLPSEFVSPISDHLTGAPLAADLYPNGVPPLFKTWTS